MNRTISFILLILAVVLLTVGMIFLCAASGNSTRLLVAIACLILGAGLAAWAGTSLRRLREQSPEQLSARIVALARAGGHGEISLVQVVAELKVPTEAAQAALDLLQSKGEAVREARQDRQVYVFPGLQEVRYIRRCSHCGTEYSIKTPLSECPRCGGQVEVVKV
jgi:DNA-directed RNA polymerase subunit RPC12/RpoP